jgi:hypothetical protein
MDERRGVVIAEPMASRSVLVVEVRHEGVNIRHKTAQETHGREDPSSLASFGSHSHN